MNASARSIRAHCFGSNAHDQSRFVVASFVARSALIAVDPLYTIWSAGTVQQRWFAVIHCTLGDAMIAGLTLLMELAALGRASFSDQGSRAVWLATIVLGVGYTVYSESLNVNVHGSWQYSEWMPTLPLLGTGLVPVLQWIAVPTLAQSIAFGRRHWIDRAKC